MPKSSRPVVAQLCQFASLLIDAFWVWLSFRMHPVYRRHMFWNKFPCLKKNASSLNSLVWLAFVKDQGMGMFVLIHIFAGTWKFVSCLITLKVCELFDHQLLWPVTPQSTKCSELLCHCGWQSTVLFNTSWYSLWYFCLADLLLYCDLSMSLICSTLCIVVLVKVTRVDIVLLSWRVQ